MDIVDEAKRLSMESLRREAVNALQDEKKQQLRRSHPRLDEAALAREHVIMNQLRDEHPYARDAVSAWLEGSDGTKGDPNAVSTIYQCSILSRAVATLKAGTVRLLLCHGAKVERSLLYDVVANTTPEVEHPVLLIVKDLIVYGSAGRDLINIAGISASDEQLGMSALLSAIATRKYDVARYLVYRGADINFTSPARFGSFQPRDAEGWAAYYTEESTFHQPTEADLLFYRFITNVRRAGGWKPFVRAPRVSLVVLRSLGEKGRARPPPELARLFALDKFIFWRVLAFWRTDLDLPHHITTREREPPMNEYFD